MGKEEAKMSLFVGSMIIYVENPYGSIEKATRTNQLSKIKNTRSMYKNQLYYIY